MHGQAHHGLRGPATTVLGFVGEGARADRRVGDDDLQRLPLAHHLDQTQIRLAERLGSQDVAIGVFVVGEHRQPHRASGTNAEVVRVGDRRGVVLRVGGYSEFEILVAVSLFLFGFQIRLNLVPIVNLDHLLVDEQHQPGDQVVEHNHVAVPPERHGRGSGDAWDDLCVIVGITRAVAPVVAGAHPSRIHTALEDDRTHRFPGRCSRRVRSRDRGDLVRTIKG